MNAQHKHGSHIERHLAQLKLVSRLLGHELHSQGGSKAIALSRDQVTEMQTALDLFIEEASKRLAGRTGGYGPSHPGHQEPSALEAPGSSSMGGTMDTQLVPARN